MQKRTHRTSRIEKTQATPGASHPQTLYFDDMQPDRRDKIRVALFLWDWGAGLVIFNLPSDVAHIVLQYLPNWKGRLITDGFICDYGMGYACTLTFNFYQPGVQSQTHSERDYQSGLQIARSSTEAHDYIRRRMSGTRLSRRPVEMAREWWAALIYRDIIYPAPQRVESRKSKKTRLFFVTYTFHAFQYLQSEL